MIGCEITTPIAQYADVLAFSPEGRAVLQDRDGKRMRLTEAETGKPLELEGMTGAVVELARRLDVEVPRVETLHACTKLLDQLSQRRRSRQAS